MDTLSPNPGPETPTHHRFVDVNGLSIFYREAGSAGAPVVLLLHGWPSSSRMFRNLIPKLGNRFRVVAPDYPGFGNSEAPGRGEFNYTFDGLAAVMESFLDKVDVKTFALYVMDFGGPIGYRLMLKQPRRLTSLVVQNAPAYPEGDEVSWWKTLAEYWRHDSDENRKKVRRYIDPESVKQQYVVGARDPSLIDPDNWLVDNALIGRPGMDEVSLDLLYDIKNNVSTFAAAREYFRRFQPPTLIVSGANDEIFPGENQKQFLNDLPNAQLHLLDAGHFALEDNCDEIAALMQEFLGRTLCAPGLIREGSGLNA